GSPTPAEGHLGQARPEGRAVCVLADRGVHLPRSGSPWRTNVPVQTILAGGAAGTIRAACTRNQQRPHESTYQSLTINISLTYDRILDYPGSVPAIGPWGFVPSNPTRATPWPARLVESRRSVEPWIMQQHILDTSSPPKYWGRCGGSTRSARTTLMPSGHPSI